MTNDLLRIVLFAVVAFVAYNVLMKDNVLSGGEPEASPVETSASPCQHDRVHNKFVSNDQIDDVNRHVLPPPQMSNLDGQFAQIDQLVASDLLPMEGGFAESNPQPQGNIMNRNLFESAHHAGLNTQSNTLKNANRQLRSDPLIPRLDVGPWHQSTYEPDTNRRNFEIGMA